MSSSLAPGAESAKDANVACTMFGLLLRELRESSGVSPLAASAHLGADRSKISRIECARVGAKPADVEKLIARYGLSDTAECRSILDFARRLREPQWWHGLPGLDGWFRSYLMLEALARHIRTYEVRFIPGLLQTPAYAEAVMQPRYEDPAEVRRRVNVRIRRQRLLLEWQTDVWAVIDEGALYEDVGTGAVMREQIEYLDRLVRNRTVRLQILGTGQAIKTGVGNSFSMLRLPIAALPDVVYLEHIASATFLNSRDEADPYFHAFTKLSAAAYSPRETLDRLQQALSGASVDHRDNSSRRSALQRTATHSAPQQRRHKAALPGAQ